MTVKKEYKSLVLALIFLSLAVILTDKVSGYYALEYYLEAPRKGNYLFAGLEGIKGVLGDYFWLKADDYYHGGVSEIARKCRGLSDCGHGHGHIDYQHPEEIKEKPGHLDFIQKINAAIMVDEHKHLGPQEAAEMLPWFRLTTLLNPHKVEAYIDGAFWLARKFQKPQEAISYLKEGLKNNPNDHRIYAELGFLYYYQGDPERAIHSLDKAISLWRDEEDGSDLNEKSAIYDFLGHLYEEKGDDLKALGYYYRFIEIFPDEKKVQDRIERIKKGEGRLSVKAAP